MKPPLIPPIWSALRGAFALVERQSWTVRPSPEPGRTVYFVTIPAVTDSDHGQ